MSGYHGLLAYLGSARPGILSYNRPRQIAKIRLRVVGISKHELQGQMVDLGVPNHIRRYIIIPETGELIFAGRFITGRCCWKEVSWQEMMEGANVK